MKRIDKNQLEYTETEAILITEYGGFDGSEFKTKAWITHGRLAMDRSQIGLMSKLETLAYHVSLKINPKTEKPFAGKSRIYIIKEWKEEQTERVFNYKGSVSQEEDTVMKEYMLIRLKRVMENQRSLIMTKNQWAILMGLENMNDLPFEDCRETIDKLHEDTSYSRISTRDIVQLFKDKHYTRNIDVINLYFTHLEKEREIRTVPHHFGRKRSKEVEEISEEDYQEIYDAKLECLGEAKSTLYFYNKAINTTKRSMAQSAIIEIVYCHLEEKFGFIDIFESLEVFILNSESSDNTVSKHEFQEAFYRKFFKLINSQQEGNERKVNGRIYFTNKFYRLHMLILIASLGYDTPKGAILNEINIFEDRLEELKRDVAEIEQGKIGVFGYFNVIEFPLSSITKMA